MRPWGVWWGIGVLYGAEKGDAYYRALGPLLQGVEEFGADAVDLVNVVYPIAHGPEVRA